MQAGYETYDAYGRQVAAHDPYRFTRSTAQPATLRLPAARPPPRTPDWPSQLQRAPYQPRLSDGRPVPPPKPTRPRPWSGGHQKSHHPTEVPTSTCHHVQHSTCLTGSTEVLPLSCTENQSQPGCPLHQLP
ncbi:hypothetical protein MRX96_039680 [Rhipicephalus microplus]